MERTEILQQIEKGLKEMTRLGIKNSQASKEIRVKLNPFFGFSENTETEGINAKGVRCVWLGDRADDILVETLPRGYGGEKRKIKTSQMVVSQLEAILSIIQGLCKQEVERKKAAAMNPTLQEILPNIDRWAKKCAAQCGPQFGAEVLFGKRPVDYIKYNSIVITEDNHQIGSISLKQYEDGSIYYNERSPLGGEWIKDEELPFNKMFRWIAKSIGNLAGRNFPIDDRQEMRELTEVIKGRLQSWQEKGMNFDLRLRNSESPEPQNWEFGFEHEMLQDGQMKISMYGYGPEKVRLNIGETSFNPTKLERIKEGIEIKAEGEAARVLYALWPTDKVVLVDDRDMPGEEPWTLADITTLYKEYVQNKNRQYIFSPFVDITHETTDEVIMDGEDMHYLSCSMAGLSPVVNVCNKKAEIIEHTKNLPQYGFIAQEWAHEVFKRQYEIYRAAEERVTDIAINKSGEGSYIRCKIDGVRQLAKRIPNYDARAVTMAENKQMALLWCTALSYKDNLMNEQVQNQGIKR